MEEVYSEERLDEAIEVSLEAVKKRAVRGVAILTGRGFVLNATAQIAQLFLLYFLTPSEMGIFWIVSAAVSFLIYFSDIGLAAALIQKKEKPSDDELKTTFTIQQSLVIALLLILFIVSPFLVNIYSLSTEGKALLYALGFSLFLSSLKSIPSVLLERKLEFGKFVLPEILENLVYSLLVVILAWKGFGISSFTYAVLARGIVGVVAIYILQPWMPGIAFSRSALKKLLNFGIPYQANTLVSVVKDQGITLVLGGILGSTAIGYLGAAQRLSQIPLRLFMDNVTKVSFPAFSRLQDNIKDLKKAVSQSVLFICFLVYPALIGFLVLVPSLIEVFPKYEKWNPALLALAIMSINTIFAAVATQMTNLLTAIGKIKLTIKLTIMYTALTIILVPALSYFWDFNGAAIGYAIVGASSVVAIIIARGYVRFSISKSAIEPLASALVMGASLLLLKNLFSANILSLVALVIIGCFIYGFSSFLIIGPSVVDDAKKIIKAFFRK